MKPITPVVGISKVINPYDCIVCGVDGVLTKGNGFDLEALKALKNIHDKGVLIFILSNSFLRVKALAECFERASFDLRNLACIITAGEILHHKLKKNKELGRKYYNLGGNLSKGIFEGLEYQEVSDLGKADFVFIGDVSALKKSVEDYNADLQVALAMRLTLVCVGTDVSAHQDGEVCISAGAIAEQYALMGGKIMTVGKPDKDVLSYLTESFSKENSKVLFVGDSFLSDMKSAKMIGADMLLVSKGVHIHALGEGYIPDVQKARQLSLNYDIYPDYLISALRW